MARHTVTMTFEVDVEPAEAEGRIHGLKRRIDQASLRIADLGYRPGIITYARQEREPEPLVTSEDLERDPPERLFDA